MGGGACVFGLDCMRLDGVFEDGHHGGLVSGGHCGWCAGLDFDIAGPGIGSEAAVLGLRDGGLQGLWFWTQRRRSWRSTRRNAGGPGEGND